MTTQQIHVLDQELNTVEITESDAQLLAKYRSENMVNFDLTGNTTYDVPQYNTLAVFCMVISGNDDRAYCFLSQAKWNNKPVFIVALVPNLDLN